MNQTYTSTTATRLLIPQTGVELYDQIMGAIEPELLSANIAYLDDRYQDETEDHRKKRYEHYTKAYAEYDKKFAAWHVSFNAKIATYRRDALRSAEREVRSREDSILTQLEEEISSASVPSKS